MTKATPRTRRSAVARTRPGSGTPRSRNENKPPRRAATGLPARRGRPVAYRAVLAAVGAGSGVSPVASPAVVRSLCRPGRAARTAPSDERCQDPVRAAWTALTWSPSCGITGCVGRQWSLPLLVNRGAATSRVGFVGIHPVGVAAPRCPCAASGRIARRVAAARRTVRCGRAAWVRRPSAPGGAAPAPCVRL
jgi:hypothetical protein